jgi:IclR family transcriptional regulator, KDG regulon repressor
MSAEVKRNPDRGRRRGDRVEAVNSVVKAIRILDRLRRVGPLTFSEVQRALDLPKSTVHKILATLEQEDFVRRDRETGRYSLGVKLIELGSGARAQLEFRKIALPLMQELSEAIDCTVHLSVLSHRDVLPVEAFESGSKTWPPYLFHGGVGIPAPLHATAAGKAILAYLDDNAALDDALGSAPLTRHTPHTIVERTKLRGELARIRKQGYAVSRGEHVELVWGVAAPIHDHDGTVIASLSALGIAARLTPERIPRIASGVVATAAEISRLIGYAAPVAVAAPRSRTAASAPDRKARS